MISQESSGRKGKLWVIVLAGGEGERLQPFVRSWLGENRPKQYCAFMGRKTMLDHTLERAARIAPPERVLTVIGRGHQRFLSGHESSMSRIIEQPERKDTAPGILFPLAYIRKEEPSATVLIFPSDHFISPTHRFLEYALGAAKLAERSRESLVLLGAEPDGPEEDYGWILPGKSSFRDRKAFRVLHFREKPGSSEAAAFQRAGGLWNTMVMAAQAGAIWNLAQSLLPDLIASFEALSSALGTPSEQAALSVVYGTIKPFNFSRDIVERAVGRCFVMPMRGVRWSDWGRRARIENTLGYHAADKALERDCLKTPQSASAAAEKIAPA